MLFLLQTHTWSQGVSLQTSPVFQGAQLLPRQIVSQATPVPQGVQMQQGWPNVNNFHPATSVHNPYGNNSTVSAPLVSDKKPWHNNNNFIVLPLSGQVRKCTGCPFQFRDPIGPPFTGLVVLHKEKDTYYDKDGNSHISSDSNH